MRVQKGRRSNGKRRAIAAAIAAAGVTAALGCALGPEQEPGCHDDADCDDGFTCLSGACFRTTTDRSAPAMDGGDGAADDGH
jgi:hypothetical protein